MSRRNPLQLNAGGHDELHRLAGMVRLKTSVSDKLDRETRLFSNLSPRRVIRQLVWLDVTAGREPFAELAMPVQEHATSRNDKHRNREVAGCPAGASKLILGHEPESRCPVSG